jgi:hypothetical protein
MFQDIDLSRECQTAYQQYQQQPSVAGISLTNSSTVTSGSINSSSSSSSSSSKGSGSGIDMQIQVLTTGYWPAPAPCPSLILPPEVAAQMESFDAFYMVKYQGRRLAWAHPLERCVVRTTTFSCDNGSASHNHS